jgi:tRNA G46 methylase TrmB
MRCDTADTHQPTPTPERNKEPILAELRKLLPPPPASSHDNSSSTDNSTPSLVLEVASGTGQHVAHFAAALPHLQWQPTDVVQDSFGSICAYAGQLTNVARPMLLDASLPLEQWPALPAPAAAVVAANVSHISPWWVRT